MGRPTKYKKRYCKDIIAFFNDPVNDNPLPLFYNFAANIDVCVDTLHEWRSVHPEFSESYKKAKEILRRKYWEKALAGDLEKTIAIFFGKVVLGYSEKTVNEITGSGGESLKINVNFVSPDDKRN
jgi:uncharacterized protein YktA (UPF0223 family)